MPKGGGAIRGMGEKFSVNAANGTCTLSIPLAAERRARQFHAAARTQLRFRAGNGPFGFGWSLSVAVDHAQN